MILPALPQRRLTFEEYLEFERASQWLCEYVGGEVYAMEGASKRHHLVTGNIYARLRTAAAGAPCQVFFGGVKLRVGNDIYYPDGVVTCSSSETHSHMILAPCLIVEVTSPSTARTDQTSKRDAYRSIASLQTYLIVEQGWQRVVRHRRDATGVWHEEDLQGDGAISLTCPEVMLTLDQIYEGLAPAHSQRTGGDRLQRRRDRLTGPHDQVAGTDLVLPFGPEYACDRASAICYQDVLSLTHRIQELAQASFQN